MNFDCYLVGHWHDGIFFVQFFCRPGPKVFFVGWLEKPVVCFFGRWIWWSLSRCWGRWIHHATTYIKDGERERERTDTNSSIGSHTHTHTHLCVNWNERLWGWAIEISSWVELFQSMSLLFTRSPELTSCLSTFILFSLFGSRSRSGSVGSCGSCMSFRLVERLRERVCYFGSLALRGL